MQTIINSIKTDELDEAEAATAHRGVDALASVFSCDSGTGAAKAKIAARRRALSVTSRCRSLSVGIVWLGAHDNIERRDVVSEFSYGSRLRMVKYLSDCVAEYSSMITITIPSSFVERVVAMGEDGGVVFKRALDTILRWIIGELEPKGKQEPSAFWFLEFTERGVPHAHIFVNGWVSKAGLSDKWGVVAANMFASLGLSDSQLFKMAGEVIRAGTRVESLRYGHDGAIGYAVKYAFKTEQKTVPSYYAKVGRFWGVRGCRKLEAAATVSVEIPNNEMYAGSLLDVIWNELDSSIERESLTAVKPWNQGVGVTLMSRAKCYPGTNVVHHALCLAERKGWARITVHETDTNGIKVGGEDDLGVY